MGKESASGKRGVSMDYAGHSRAGGPWCPRKRWPSGGDVERPEESGGQADSRGAEPGLQKGRGGREEGEEQELVSWAATEETGLWGP